MLTILCIALLVTLARCSHNQDFTTKTINVGDDVTLKCSRQSTNSEILFWNRLIAGKVPEILGATYSFDHYAVNKAPRTVTQQESGVFVLKITQTRLSDTGFYYCEEIRELQKRLLNITFLRIKEPEPDITSVVEYFPSNPVLQGNSATLQCSILSDPRKKTCPGDQNVFLFGSGSDKFHPRVLHVHGKSSDGCERGPDSLLKCSYNFSRHNITSSDAGTYYCAVAKCGEIVFGKGAEVKVEVGMKTLTYLVLLSTALALSWITIAFLVYTLKKDGCFNDAALQESSGTFTNNQQRQQTDEDSLVYSAPNFTNKKLGRSPRKGTKAVEGETVYADVRVLQY